MRAMLAAVVAGFFLALPTAPAGAQSRAAAILHEEETLRQAESERFAAMMRGDTTALRRLLADELTYTHSNALVETKADHLLGIGSQRTVYESIAPVAFRYRIYGDMAVGAGTVKSRGRLADTPFDVTLRVTTVHIKRNRRWTLLAWQSTRTP